MDFYSQKLSFEIKKRKVASRTQSKLKDANTKHISQRPSYINSHHRFGHWELDLIESAGDGGYIISFIERMSRFSITKYIDTKEAHIINSFLKPIIKKYPVYSITTDNSSEFNKLYKLKSSINNLEIYYTDPAAPWQKGLVEYFNKLLREYIPKKSVFTNQTSRKISFYTNKINSRQIPILNFNSPEQVKNILLP